MSRYSIVLTYVEILYSLERIVLNACRDTLQLLKLLKYARYAHNSIQSTAEMTGLSGHWSCYRNLTQPESCCVVVARQQSSTSWVSNLGFHCEIFKIINCIQKMVEDIFDIKLLFFSNPYSETKSVMYMYIYSHVYYLYISSCTWKSTITMMVSS